MWSKLNTSLGQSSAYSNQYSPKAASPTIGEHVKVSQRSVNTSTKELTTNSPVAKRGAQPNFYPMQNAVLQSGTGRNTADGASAHDSLKVQGNEKATGLRIGSKNQQQHAYSKILDQMVKSPGVLSPGHKKLQKFKKNM